MCESDLNTPYIWFNALKGSFKFLKAAVQIMKPNTLFENGISITSPDRNATSIPASFAFFRAISIKSLPISKPRILCLPVFARSIAR